MVDKNTNDLGKETADDDRKGRMLKTGIGIGIGSAAIVAALLYANQSRKKKPSPTAED